jgi:hypothetical protein
MTPTSRWRTASRQPTKEERSSDKIPEGAPFTGNFTSTYTIPTTHPGTGAPLVSVELYAAIGYGGSGLGAIDNPVDSTSTVYTPDCHGSVVDGLIAALKRILLEIFGS